MGVSKDKEQHGEGGGSLLLRGMKGTASCQIWLNQRCGRMTWAVPEIRLENEYRGQIPAIRVSCDKESFTTWKQWWKNKGFKTGV